jgi:multidrug efflux pump subunit AcrA (membrane-fusion protein)
MMKAKIKAMFTVVVGKVSHKNRILLGIIGGGMLMAGGVMATAPKHDPNVTEEKAWPVSTMIVSPQQLSPQLQLFGRVESQDHAQLTAAVTATVATVNVEEGQMVAGGDVLLTLDDADEVLRLQQRQADLRDAQAGLLTVQRGLDADSVIAGHMRKLHQLTLAKAARLSTLQQRNLVATEQLEDTQREVARQAIELASQELKLANHPQLLDMAQAQVQRAQARFEEQELNLSRTLIVAPFDGRVTQVNATSGDRVRAGDKLVSLYDTASLRVRAAIPSAASLDLKRALRDGQAVVAWLDHGRERIPLQLQQLAAEVSRGRSGVDGLFSVGTGADVLELGRAVDLTLELSPLSAVVGVPVQSLYGEDRVYTVSDGRLQAIIVTSEGQRIDSEGNYQVLVRAAELQAGTPVLTTTLPKASTGLRVAVIGAGVLAAAATDQSGL